MGLMGGGCRRGRRDERAEHDGGGQEGIRECRAGRWWRVRRRSQGRIVDALGRKEGNKKIAKRRRPISAED